MNACVQSPRFNLTPKLNKHSHSPGCLHSCTVVLPCGGDATLFAHHAAAVLAFFFVHSALSHQLQAQAHHTCTQTHENGCESWVLHFCSSWPQGIAVQEVARCSKVISVVCYRPGISDHLDPRRPEVEAVRARAGCKCSPVFPNRCRGDSDTQIDRS